MADALLPPKARAIISSPPRASRQFLCAPAVAANLKQILMIRRKNLDRTPTSKMFRDDDPAPKAKTEFTQLDLEMSPAPARYF